MDWLHWIGQGLYTPKRFLVEAERTGVHRRVPMSVLKRMQWGDWVYCLCRPGKRDKTGVVFCRFQVSRIAGLTQDITDRLSEQGLLDRKISDGGEEVEKECGSFIQGATFATRASIEDICKGIEESESELNADARLDEDLSGLPCLSKVVGKPTPREHATPMVSGRLEEILPWARLKDVPFFQGARTFDSDRFWALLRSHETEGEGTIITLGGMFYTDFLETTPRETSTSVKEVMQVRNYQRKRR